MDHESRKARPTWRRKTAEERRRDALARDLDPRQALLMGGITALVGAAIGGWAVLETGGNARHLIVFALAGAIVLGVPAAALAYGLQATGWLSRPNRARMGICGSCFKLTLDGSLDQCDCGGTFEDIDGWTPNRCSRCGYDLRGSPHQCPECGAPLPQHSMPDAPGT